MDMKVAHQIKAEDLLSLIYCLSTEACTYHGLEEDEANELTLDMFTEFLEQKARKKEVINLLVSK